jgi:hypothetical protein
VPVNSVFWSTAAFRGRDPRATAAAGPALGDTSEGDQPLDRCRTPGSWRRVGRDGGLFGSASQRSDAAQGLADARNQVPAPRLQAPDAADLSCRWSDLREGILSRSITSWEPSCLHELKTEMLAREHHPQPDSRDRRAGALGTAQYNLIRRDGARR